METLLGLCVGIGLSAACGFRIFVPLLIMSIASMTGDITLAAEFEWIGTPEALGAFAVATVLEIGAYYVPWLDNLLDSVAIPVSTVAGTIVMASAVGDMSPFLKWALAVIVGGGTAATVQAFTSITRVASAATTGGLANPFVSTLEAGGSIFMSLLAIFLPMIAVFAVIALIFFAVKKAFSKFFRREELKVQH